MKQTRLLMGMPITVEIVQGNQALIDEVFAYFQAVDERYSTYKPTSEISRINRGLPLAKASAEMQSVLALCEQTKQQSHGFFDITHDGQLDPSGLVKGWSIHNAAELLLRRGARNFYVEAGGDIQAHGHNANNEAWQVGIRSPFNDQEIIKVVNLSDAGMATSGSYVRGQHIYNPHAPGQTIDDIKSLTVIGPNVYEADRFATAAFAMGREGINFINSLSGLEGYLIDAHQRATFTPGFERFLADA